MYEYMCVMSTIPNINPALGTNYNSKSKTQLNSGSNPVGAFVSMAMKSNRGHASPNKADK